MKIAQKITFKGKIGFDSVVKVFYKDVYFGRIIFNYDGLMEFHEKNESSFHKYNINDPEFNDQDKIKDYVIKKILAHEKQKKEDREFNLSRLTPSAKEFFNLFKSNNLRKRKELDRKYWATAEFFVIETLLEKGTVDGNVVYYTKNPVSNLLLQK